jgi:hypothetical protein
VEGYNPCHSLGDIHDPDLLVLSAEETWSTGAREGVTL